MASFDGVTFTIMGMDQPSDLSVEISDRACVGSGGTATWYRDVGPIRPEEFSYRVRFDSYSDLNSLKAKVGATGSLVDFDATRTAILESVGRPQRLPSGKQFVQIRLREA